MVDLYSLKELTQRLFAKKSKEKINRNFDNDIVEAYKKEIGILLELNSSGIIFLDRFKIINVNESIEKMLLTPKDKLIGKDITSFLVHESARKKKSGKYTALLKRSNGHVFNAEFSLKSLKMKEKKITIVCIKEENDIDTQILNAVIESEERIRLHFSNEIHNGLGPAITVLQIYFQWLAESSEENKEFIVEKGNFYFHEAINILKEISAHQNPLIVENLGLITALNMFISRLNITPKIEIKFTYNFEKRLNLQLEILIYRIVSELINNTLKYANASLVVLSVCICDINKIINIKYVDNGKGINFQNSRENYNNFGIVYIKSRVQAMKGSFQLKNCENMGVNIDISIPIIVS